MVIIFTYISDKKMNKFFIFEIEHNRSIMHKTYEKQGE
jgi:hypothetical protein